MKMGEYQCPFCLFCLCPFLLTFEVRTGFWDKNGQSGQNEHKWTRSKKVALEIDFFKCVLKIVIALCWLIYIISIYTFRNLI